MTLKEADELLTKKLRGDYSITIIYWNERSNSRRYQHVSIWDDHDCRDWTGKDLASAVNACISGQEDKTSRDKRELEIRRAEKARLEAEKQKEVEEQEKKAKLAMEQTKQELEGK